MNEKYLDYTTLEQLMDYNKNINKYLDYYKYDDYSIKPEKSNIVLEEFLKQWKNIQTKEERWLEQLKEMDLTIVEQFVRRKKLERIKDIDNK